MHRLEINKDAYLILLSLLFLSQFLFGQDFQNYAITNYNLEDGLPSNECHDILQDSLGYIWIATDRGLVRYNGYEFKVYGPKQGLTNISCLDICLASNNDIWIHSWRSGIFKYIAAEDTIVYHEVNMLIPDYQIEYIAEIRSNTVGELLISFRKYGFMVFDKANKIKNVINRNEESRYRTIEFEDEVLVVQDEFDDLIEMGGNLILNNRFLIEHDGRGYSGVINNNTDYLSSENPFAYKFSNGTVFFSLFGSSYFLNQIDSLKIDHNNTFFLDIIETPNGEILAGKRFLRGLDLFSNYNAFRNNKGGNLIPDISVTRLISTKNGDVWLSCLENGIYKLSSKEAFSIKSTSKHKIVSLEEFNQGLFMIEDYRNISKYKNGRIIKNEIQNHIEIYDLANIKTINQLLVCGQNTYRVDKKMNTYKIFRNYFGDSSQLSSKECFPFDEDEFVFRHSKIIYLYDNLKKSDLYTSEVESCVNLTINSVERIAKNHYLLGTNSGLFEFCNEEIFPIETQYDGLKNRINSIKRIENKFLFGTLGNGLVLWDLESTPLAISMQDGLISNNIEKIVTIDEDVFICSKSGFSKIVFSDNEDYEIRNYSTYHDLPSNEINDLCYYNDTLFIATGKGLAYLTDFDVKSESNVPILENVSVNSKSYRHLNHTLKLEYFENDVDIKFATLDYKMEGNILYRYKLSGSEWSETKNTQVNLNSMSPNKYTFEIQSLNRAGIWSPSASLDFEIQEPWWRTIPFYFICGLLFFGSVYLLYIRRFRNIESQRKIEKEVENLERAALQAQMNPHFIFNCLNSIQNYIYENERVTAMEYLSKFSRLIRQSLNASRENKVSLKEEISMLENYLDLEKMRLKDKFSYHLEVADEIDTQSVHFPSLLIQPFVENAIKHGISNLDSDGWIKIKFSKKANNLEINIRDNGNKKFDDKKEDEHRSYGSTITSKRLAFINNSENKDYTIKPIFHAEYTEVQIAIDLTSQTIN